MERKLLQKAYGHFLDKWESAQILKGFPFSYDLCDPLAQVNWGRIPFLKGVVSGELRETINTMNSWANNLMKWECWISVLEEIEAGFNDFWTIRDHFVEPIVFYCMFQPNSMRDRFGTIATHAAHFATLSLEPSYQDHLKQDKKKRPDIPLGRKESEKQMNNLGIKWKSFKKFEQELKKIDSDEYRKNTSNYRNLASHNFPPHFDFGHTMTLQRSIVPTTKMIRNKDGTFRKEEVKNSKSLAYGYGGIQPIKLTRIFSENKLQFFNSSRTLHCYETLLNEILSELKSLNFKLEDSNTIG